MDLCMHINTCVTYMNAAEPLLLHPHHRLRARVWVDGGRMDGWMHACMQVSSMHVDWAPHHIRLSEVDWEHAYVYMYVCVCVYIYIYLYIYIYIYIYI